MSRHRYNRLILKELEKSIEDFPNQRIAQIMLNIGLSVGYPTYEGDFVMIDEYNRESEDIYNRIQETKKEKDEQQE